MDRVLTILSMVTRVLIGISLAMAYLIQCIETVGHYGPSFAGFVAFFCCLCGGIIAGDIIWRGVVR